jgi:CAAX prenyl protease-like protein
MPLLAILAAGMASHAMSSSGFEPFYPLRLVAGAAMLWIYRKRLLATLGWRWGWRGPAVGLCVFVVWIFAAHFLVPREPEPAKLLALSSTVQGLWIASRLAASILVVPIAEEVAYRGYLMRRLISEDFESVRFQSVGWPAIIISALAFGLMHGALWLPGIAAGLAFGLVTVRRGAIGEAVAAHATANALIAVAVLGWHQWQLW